MDDYPENCVSPARPLVVLSGLVKPAGEEKAHEIQRNGPVLSSEVPIVTGPLAQDVLDVFSSWNAVQPSSSRSFEYPIFTFKTCGRQYTFPCTKASPRPSPVSPSLETSKPSGSPSTLHSPLSPLSPSSSLYPDGLLSSQWISKYQEVIPSVFVSFFVFGSHPTHNGTLDSQLAEEIARIRSFFENSTYRTRFAVVLVGDESVLDTDGIDERLENIRRGAKIDNRGAFFVIPPGVSLDELSEFVSTIITSIRPLASDFYRDLMRHARRKRDKAYNPPLVTLPDGRVQPVLSASGWTTRYNYKLGLFAEYRGEWDMAAKSYISVVDGLFEAHGLLETSSCWSSRWNELRTFADTCNVRMIRCLLRNNQTVMAVRRWRIYRIQTHWILNRRGKGTLSYGWSAWEARWTKVMAQLVQNYVELPKTLAKDSSAQNLTGFPAFVLGTTAQLLEDRQLPWEFVHHAGYWFFLSSEFMRARREKAESIPDRDKLPPGQSPASSVARQSELYDTYLCPEPYLEYPSTSKGAVNHTQLIINLLDEAVTEFRARGQISMADRLDLTIGEELIQNSRFTEALLILKPIWRRGLWRRTHWWKLSTELVWSLYQCAVKLSDFEVMFATHWELLSSEMLVVPHLNYDFHASIKQLSTSPGEQSNPIVIHLSDDLRNSPIKANFLFETAECHASETIRAQLTVISNTHDDVPRITLSSIIIGFTGALQSVQLFHDEPEAASDDTSSLLYYSVTQLEEKKDADLPDARRALTGSADLTLAPGRTNVYSFDLLPRETGSVHLQSIVATIQTESFNMTIPMYLSTSRSISTWYCTGPYGVRGKRAAASLASTKVLPRQPRMDIKILNVNEQYFMNEKVLLEIEVTNNESEAADATLDIQIHGDHHDPPRYGFASDDESTLEAKTLSVSLESLAPSQKALRTVTVQIPSTALDLRLQVHTTYRLISDPESSIIKSFSTDLPVVGPFEANYELSAAVHPDDWPSYFDVSDDDDVDDDSTREVSADEHIAAADHSPRLHSRWNLKAIIASFASDKLIIENTELAILKVHDHHSKTSTPTTTCTAYQDRDRDQPVDLAIGTKEQRSITFTIDSSNPLEPRKSPTEVEAALLIYWRRAAANNLPIDSLTLTTTTNCTTLAMPTLTLNNNEPRILASIHHHASSSPATTTTSTATSDPSSSSSSSLPSHIILDYTFENPTLHLLPLSITMDPSAEYAFSGAKQTNLQLLPLSRCVVRYVLLPLTSGIGIGSSGSSSGSRNGDKGKRKSKNGETASAPSHRYIRPLLKITDTYFKQTLKPIGVGSGVKNDGDGVLVRVADGNDGGGGGV